MIVSVLIGKRTIEIIINIILDNASILTVKKLKIKNDTVINNGISTNNSQQLGVTIIALLFPIPHTY